MAFGPAWSADGRRFFRLSDKNMGRSGNRQKLEGSAIQHLLSKELFAYSSGSRQQWEP